MPSDYHFLDQEYEKLYQTEIRTSTMFSYGTGIAIAIACVGLFGLSSFLIQQRTREIGIRKVLGASEPGLVFKLSGEFSGWILLANVIAWPIGWYAMNNWLQNFAYRIDLTIWPFLLSGAAALLIALLTISWQAVRAATANPVKALRNE